MPNVKISAAADAGTLLSSDMLPLARSGDASAYHATMAEVATYASVTVASGAYGNVGRNLVHNSMFTVAQRAGGPFTTSGVYTLDRWQTGFVNGTLSVSLIAPADADRAAIGDEAATSAMQCVVAGGAGAASYTTIIHPIEGVRRLGGKTVTISLWAKAASGTPKLGFSLDQSFGTGGSPSAYLPGTGSAVTIGTTWARYSVTRTLPSTAGKTLGTNLNDGTPLNIWFSNGTTYTGASGGVGVQSGTFQIWGVQIEIGSVATPLEKLDPALQLQQCQRFYSLSGLRSDGFFVGATGIAASGSLPVSMRALPAITMYTNASSNLSGISLGAIGLDAFYATGTAAANVAYSLNIAVTASADL